MHHLLKILMLTLTLAMFNLHAQEDLPDEPLLPEEEEFQNGNRGDRGNEDSDAVSNVQVGQPSYGGTGCPQGTLSSALSSDQKTLAIIFDQFAVRAGLSLGKRNQLACNLRIPIQVPAGFKVEATRIDYRGFVNAPKRGRGVIRAQYQLLDQNGKSLGGRMIRRRSVFRGPYSDMYLVSSRVKVGPSSRCGESVILSITNTAIAVSQKGEEAIVTVDTIDSETDAIKYHLRWKRCK